MKQIITSNKTIIAAALLTLGLTGCALTPATESLNYQAQTGVAHVAHAENVTVNVVTTDSRVDKLISHKKNGYGMKLAGISSAEPVNITVNKAIEQELTTRGFHLDSNSDIKITADVTKFYTEQKARLLMFGNDASVALLISIKTNNVEIYKKEVTGNYDIFRPAVGFEGTTECLEGALKNAMNNLFNDKGFIAALTTAVPTQAAAN
jgi:uncharacterized lipoprotein YajG